MNYDKVYDEAYYARYGDGGYDGGAMENIHEGVYSGIANLLGPQSMLDVGCALGYMVAFAREEYGIDAFGVDVSTYAHEHSACPDYHAVADCSEPIDFGREFELVLCIEVAEHMLEEDALVLIDNLTNAASKYIYFSSDSTSFESINEPTHINFQTDEYWIKQFEERGFVRYEHYTPDPILRHAMLFLNEEILE